ATRGLNRLKVTWRRREPRQIQGARLRLTDQGLTLSHLDPAILPLHNFHLGLERGRLQKPHRQGFGRQRGNQPREISAIGRIRRSAKAARNSDRLHIRSWVPCSCLCAHDTRCWAASHSAKPISAAHREVSLSVSSEPLTRGARTPKT